MMSSYARKKENLDWMKCRNVSCSPAAVHRRLAVTCAWTEPILSKLDKILQSKIDHVCFSSCKFLRS